MGFGGLLMASAVLWPWATLSASLIAYLVMLPISLARSAERRRRRIRAAGALIFPSIRSFPAARHCPRPLAASF